MEFISKKSISMIIVKNDIKGEDIQHFQLSMHAFLKQKGSQLILYISHFCQFHHHLFDIIADTAINAKKVNKELILCGENPQLKKEYDTRNLHFYLKYFFSLKEATKYFKNKV
ncbi:MAG: hypothetical protein ABF649_13300 [Bacillus sp. (in: firmicutes)]